MLCWQYSMANMHWIIFASLFSCTIAQKATTGREFVTAFLSFDPSCTLQLDISSSTNGDVQLCVPYLGINNTYSFNRTFSKTLDSTLQLYGTKIGHNGVYIKSSVDVSVFVTTSYYSSSEDTYVSLPVQSLGKVYSIASYTPYTAFMGHPSLFMVISAFANTEVNISFPNGTLISKTLNWLDVYQEASSLIDLTGTVIQSSKPISVVSGASCTRIVESGCDMISEQMIPTKAFEMLFIVPPIPYNQFIIRIFSSQNNNKVCVKDSSFENCTSMGSNQWIESAPKNSSLVVTSQEPISVIQYKGDQMYMAIIPGIRQFMNSYTFVVPEVYVNQESYISVTILSSASQTLNLDGKPPRYQVGAEPTFYNYTVLTFRVTAGYHVMTSTETHVLFGLIVFGLNNNTSFGYPAGMNFDIDECASNPCLYGGSCSNGFNGYHCTCRAGLSGRNCGIDMNECASSPCLHGGTCSDGVNDYTCTCIAGFSGRKCEIISDFHKQLICYSCEDMSDLELCDTVTKCADGEVCVVEQNHAKYRSGCANSSICSTHYPSSSKCAECCSNDYCNGRGCGDEGLVSRQERGPLCYDCTHVRTIQQCTSIRPCNKHQTCSIEEFEWLDHTHFKLGCEDSPCSAIGNGLQRSLPRCKSCCDQDFCNTNCTHHQSIGIIG